MDPKKVEAIFDWPTPISIKGLRGFLVIAGYYWRFIQNFEKLTAPMTDLLKKIVFQWFNELTQAFGKEALIEARVLTLPNFMKTGIIESDALGVGVGAVLMQENRS